MGIDKEAEIVERELWDHYSELPNPSWYEYKDKEEEDVQKIKKILELPTMVRRETNESSN